MSLNLQLRARQGRWEPKQRRRMLVLAGIALALACLVALQRTWEPRQALANLQRGALSSLPASISVPALQAEIAMVPQSDNVVMAASTVIENPHSTAYTTDLYSATGKDPIPWPNVNGRVAIETYTVQSGDSLWGIATQFGLDIDTLRWSNPDLERNPDILSVGAELRILPVTGLYHTVTSDDETIESIAALYGIAPIDISHYPPNGLFPPYDLAVGSGVIVPFGRKDIVVPRPALSPLAELAWPLVGVITNGYRPDEHPALDIGAPYGATIYAAEDGTITYADWATTGYGYTVIIDNGNRRETWYNHLKGTLLPAGSPVSRGTPIGEVGSTGHSTGPHLHLEVRVNGERVNPLEYLPSATPR